MAVVDVLYSDRFCTLTKSDVTLNIYYFPLFTGRKVPLSSIKALFYDSQHCDFATTKSWGMALSPIWWALDCCRECGGKNTNVVLDIGELSLKGFTVADIQQFLQAIVPLLNPGTPVTADIPY